ncbi:unnamed protein product, partial [Tilletia controversa]
DDEWITAKLNDSYLVLSSSPAANLLVPSFLQLPLTALQVEDGAPSPDSPPSRPLDLSQRHQEILTFLKDGKNPPSASTYAVNKAFLRKASRYFVVGDCLWRRSGIEGAGRLVVDDKEQQERLMRMAHEESGHKGVLTTARILEERYFWKKLLLDRIGLDITYLP